MARDKLCSRMEVFSMRWVNAMQDIPFLVYAWLSFPGLHFQLLEGRNLYYMINLKLPTSRVPRQALRKIISSKMIGRRSLLQAPM